MVETNLFPLVRSSLHAFFRRTTTRSDGEFRDVSKYHGVSDDGRRSGERSTVNISNSLKTRCNHIRNTEDKEPRSHVSYVDYSTLRYFTAENTPMALSVKYIECCVDRALGTSQTRGAPRKPLNRRQQECLECQPFCHGICLELGQ